jgi:maltose-binding protein MalE
MGSGLPLLAALLLTGCRAGDSLPNVLHLGVQLNPYETIDANLVAETRRRLGLLEAGYRQLNSNTRLQLSQYTFRDMARAIQRRTSAGLGPDLLLINAQTAKRLLAAGLIEPYPEGGAEVNRFNPQLVDRVRSPSGALAGLPLLVKTELACFNRSRLAEAPATLQELLNTGAKGHPVGLTTEGYSLVWTIGSLGALDAINTAAAGRQPSRAQQQAIEAWLTWLQRANNQVHITFYASQSSAEAEFEAGRLDWFPCPSAAMPRLRNALGNALGVAPLPHGEGGDPSPVNTLQVLALGSHGSRRSREQALAFSHFSASPLSQRELTLGSQVVLPANRFVKVPVNSSAVLRAMVTSAEQGNRTNALIGLINLNDPRVTELQTLLTNVVFGEVQPGSAARSLVAILRNRS